MSTLVAYVAVYEQVPVMWSMRNKARDAAYAIGETKDKANHAEGWNLAIKQGYTIAKVEVSIKETVPLKL